MQDTKEWPSLILPGIKLHVTGHSRAGEATGFYLRQLKWFLDAGVPTAQIKPERVFITHSHTDHSMMLPLLVNRTKPMQVYAPKEAVPFIDEYVAGMNRMNQQSGEWADRSGGYNYIGVAAGDVLEIDKKYSVEIIECEHPVTSVGYCFFEKKKRLQEQYRNKPNQVLGQLRKEGVTIDEEVKVPAFVFLGDSSCKVLTRYADVLGSYPVVFVECTFLYPDHKSAADDSMHIHWSDLKPLVLKSPDTCFILIHFSRRYSDKEIAEFFSKEQKEAQAACSQPPASTSEPSNTIQGDSAEGVQEDTGTTHAMKDSISASQPPKPSPARLPLSNIIPWLPGLNAQ